MRLAQSRTVSRSRHQYAIVGNHRGALHHLALPRLGVVLAQKCSSANVVDHRLDDLAPVVPGAVRPRNHIGNPEHRLDARPSMPEAGPVCAWGVRLRKPVRRLTVPGTQIGGLPSRVRGGAAQTISNDRAFTSNWSRNRSAVFGGLSDRARVRRQCAITAASGALERARPEPAVCGRG